jgi:hypothetical protein
MKEEEIKEVVQSVLNCEPEEFYKKYKKYKKAEEEFNKLFEPFKKGLIQLHEEHPDLPNTVVVGGTKLIYVSPSVRTSIDSKKLKEEEPEIAKKFTKTTNVSASIRIDGI